MSGLNVKIMIRFKWIHMHYQCCLIKRYYARVCALPRDRKIVSSDIEPGVAGSIPALLGHDNWAKAYFLPLHCLSTRDHELLSCLCEMIIQHYWNCVKIPNIIFPLRFVILFWGNKHQRFLMKGRTKRVVLLILNQ